MVKVAIIDCNRNGLANIRSIGAIPDTSVIAIDHNWRKPGIHSKYVDQIYFAPRPQHDLDRFISRLCDIGAKELESNGTRTKLLPVNDEYVRTLAAHWSTLSEYYDPLFETDSKKLDIITNKLNFSEFCASNNIPQPQKHSIADVLDDKVVYPIIFKPDERRTLKNLEAKIFRLHVSESKEDGKQFAEYCVTNQIDVIIQQFIPGGDDELYTGGVSAWQGHLHGCFTGKKVRQFPPMAGEAALARSIKSEKLINYCEQIVSALKFTGIGQIEFKHHNGEFYMIEMNPRSWSWHGLAAQAGVDLPRILYNASSGDQSKSLISNTQDDKEWHFFLEDFVHNYWLNNNITLAELWSSHKRAHAHAFYRTDDLLPWIAHAGIDYPIKVLKTLLNK